MNYKKWVFYDLLDHSTYFRLLKDSSIFKKEVSALNKKATVIIDEAQRLPRLLDDVHHFLSLRKSQLQFVLSGSSAGKLKSKAVNLLAGRSSQNFFSSYERGFLLETYILHELKV